MKNKISKKVILPLFLIALCFISSRPTVVTPPTPSGIDSPQIMPTSNMEDAAVTDDN